MFLDGLYGGESPDSGESGDSIPRAIHPLLASCSSRAIYNKRLAFRLVIRVNSVIMMIMHIW